VVDYEGLTRGGKTNPFEMVLLPLEGGIGSPRSLGAITPLTKPYWLGADPVIEGRVDSLRVVDPDRELLFLGDRHTMDVPSIAPGEAHLVGSDTTTLENGRRIRHLVVFEGGKDS
jgi:hypothetical protein